MLNSYIRIQVLRGAMSPGLFASPRGRAKGRTADRRVQQTNPEKGWARVCVRHPPLLRGQATTKAKRGEGVARVPMRVVGVLQHASSCSTMATGS